MLNGYVEFFMEPSLADCYKNLKNQLDELLQRKVTIPPPVDSPPPAATRN